jgi:2-polyprenylphenol 6-hydroxylase
MQRATKMTDIAVIGAGVTGLALALALAQNSDYRIHLIAPLPPSPPTGQGGRVLALNAASIAFLSELGIWPLNTPVAPIWQMQVWDAEGTGRINFTANSPEAKLALLGAGPTTSPEASLGFIVEAAGITFPLWGALRKNTRVTWHASQLQALGPANGHAGRMLALTDGTQIGAGLCIAADGALSSIRQAAGIACRERHYGQTAITAWLTTEKPHGNSARQLFHQSGPLAFLPLADATACSSPGHRVAMVWSQQDAAAADLFSSPAEVFHSAIERAGEFCLGAVIASQDRQAFDLRERHADTYYRDGVVLIGDAAHSLHPLAGQGANLGLADAEALVTELKRAETRGIPLSHPSLYNRYERRRRLHNRAGLVAMQGFHQLFTATHPFWVLARNQGLARVNQSPRVKQFLMSLAQGQL